MNTNYKTTDWTIGECCTKATGVVLSHFRGTATEVQILLLKMVKQLKNIDSGEYVHGTETLKELTSEHEEYTAAAVFWSYEVKITAKETCHVKEITDKYVAGDFKATDEKMQELKKGLKSNHEALENFLGVKLSSLNPAEIEEQMEETISQMPEEELEKVYDKYAFSVERNISHILTVSTGHISKKTPYGEYDKDGWKVPNPSALPWEKNNFKGAFELKSANGAFGIRIEVQQGRHVPY